MASLQIIAPRIVNENGQVVESKAHIEIIVDDGYDYKDFLKENGFAYQGFTKNWVKLETRKYFKENAFTEIRKIATALKVRPQISGEQANEAVATMNK